MHAPLLVHSLTRPVQCKRHHKSQVPALFPLPSFLPFEVGACIFFGLVRWCTEGMSYYTEAPAPSLPPFRHQIRSTSSEKKSARGKEQLMSAPGNTSCSSAPTPPHPATAAAADPRHRQLLSAPSSSICQCDRSRTVVRRATCRLVRPLSSAHFTPLLLARTPSFHVVTGGQSRGADIYTTRTLPPPPSFQSGQRQRRGVGGTGTGRGRGRGREGGGGGGGRGGGGESTTIAAVCRSFVVALPPSLFFFSSSLCPSACTEILPCLSLQHPVSHICRSIITKCDYCKADGKTRVA